MSVALSRNLKTHYQHSTNLGNDGDTTAKLREIKNGGVDSVNANAAFAWIYEAEECDN